MGVMLKSAYAPYDSQDGARYLVETLWPEGVDTYYLSPYKWVQELAPSYDMKEMALWKNWTREKFQDEYKKELQEPHRRRWFDRIIIEAREGPVTLLHRSHKKENAILPEDATVYYLREFLETELSKCRELPQTETLPATVVHPDSGSNEDAEQWFNEGRR